MAEGVACAIIVAGALTDNIGEAFATAPKEGENEVEE